MKEIGDNMPMKEMEQAKQELNQNRLNSEMQKSEQNMKNGDFNQSQQFNKSKQEFEKFCSKYDVAQKSMEDKVSKEAMRKLQQAMMNLLELSEQQENLQKSTQNATANSVQVPKLAETQSEILEAIANVTNMMVELSQKTFAVTPEMGKHLGDAMQSMQSAIQNMSNRSTQKASQEQAQAR